MHRDILNDSVFTKIKTHAFIMLYIGYISYDFSAMQFSKCTVHCALLRGRAGLVNPAGIIK